MAFSFDVEEVQRKDIERYHREASELLAQFEASGGNESYLWRIMNACRRSPRLSGEPPLHPLPPAVYDYFATASHKVCLLLQGLDFREEPEFPSGTGNIDPDGPEGPRAQQQYEQELERWQNWYETPTLTEKQAAKLLLEALGLQFPSRNMLKNLKSHERSVSAAARYRKLRDEGVPQADAEEMLMEQLGVSDPRSPHRMIQRAYGSQPPVKGNS